MGEITFNVLDDSKSNVMLPKVTTSNNGSVNVHYWTNSLPGCTVFIDIDSHIGEIVLQYIWKGQVHKTSFLVKEMSLVLTAMQEAFKERTKERLPKDKRIRLLPKSSSKKIKKVEEQK